MDRIGVRDAIGEHRREVWRTLTSRLRCLPDVLIVGAMKAGTTFLHACLTEHPAFVPALEKEVHFFDNAFYRGETWYRSQFPIRPWLSVRRARTLVAGEASPYYLFHPLAAQRAREVCPNARVIALLRDPVDRAYSHHQQNVRVGFETLNFEEALDVEAERLAGEERKLEDDGRYYSMPHQTFSYLARGEYKAQLDRWHRAFGRERVLVLQSEQLWADPERAYRAVLRFTGLAPHTPRGFRPRNRGRYQTMDPALRARLAAHFQPHNERLFAALGQRFDWATPAADTSAERVALAG